MFTKHGKEPSWILQFSKQERLLMLAMANDDVKRNNDLMKNIKVGKRKR